MYDLYVKQKVEAGLAALTEDKTATHKEAVRSAYYWAFRLVGILIPMDDAQLICSTSYSISTTKYHFVYWSVIILSEQLKIF